MEFPGALMKEHVEIPGIKYKWSGISRVKKKMAPKICGMFQVLALEFPKGVTQFGIFTGEALFFLEFPRVAIYSKKIKIPGVL